MRSCGRGHRAHSSPVLAESNLMEVGTSLSPRHWEHPKELRITTPASSFPPVCTVEAEPCRTCLKKVNKYIADDTWGGEVVCLSLATQPWGPRGSHCCSAELCWHRGTGEASVYAPRAAWTGQHVRTHQGTESQE